MGRFQWFSDRWPTIRDNAVYDGLKWIVVSVLGLGAFFVMKYLLPAFTSLTPDEAKLISVVVSMLVITAASLMWVTSRRMATPTAESPTPTDSLNRIPQFPHIEGFRQRVGDLPSTPPDIVARPLKDPNIHIELREILFRSQQSTLFSQSGCLILMNLTLVNRGSIEATLPEWSLRVVVGSEAFTARVAPIPAALHIERPGKALQDRTFERIRTPTLDETPHEPYKRGIPRTGWVMFFMQTFAANYAPPYNATFVLTVKDAMGEQHELTFGPSFYEPAGDLVYQ